MGLDRRVTGFVVIRGARSGHLLGELALPSPLDRPVALRTTFQWMAESVIGCWAIPFQAQQRPPPLELGSNVENASLTPS